VTIHLLLLHIFNIVFHVEDLDSAERGIAKLSVRRSVRPSVCLSVCNVQVPWSYMLEFLENNFHGLANLSSLCIAYPNTTQRPWSDFCHLRRYI